MFFTKAARVIAWLMVVVGALRALLGLTIALSGQSMSPRYLGSHSAGEAIDHGVLYVLIGVAVGMLAEISRSVAAKAEVAKQVE